MNIFSQPRLVPCGGSCQGWPSWQLQGWQGLVRELHPLGGDHEAFVVSGGANLDFNIAKVQLKSSWCNSPLFLRMKLDLSLMIPHAISLKTFITTSENCNISNNSWASQAGYHFEGLFKHKTPYKTDIDIWHFSLSGTALSPTVQ